MSNQPNMTPSPVTGGSRSLTMGALIKFRHGMPFCSARLKQQAPPVLQCWQAQKFTRILQPVAMKCVAKSAAPMTKRCILCRAAEDNAEIDKETLISRILDAFPTLGEGLGSVFLFLLWAAVVGYALFLSPNQTPYRDQYFIQKLIGLKRDNFEISTLFVCLFNAMGIYPLIFLCLLQPSAKSSNKVPLWPFTTLSFGLGFLALGLYFALWKPSVDVKVPPKQQELEGIGNLSLKGTESSLLSIAILLIVVILLVTASGATISRDQWTDFLRLFDESRLVHVSTIDFTLLTSAVPFWMWNDAQLRNWSGRDRWLPVLSVVPLLGPAIYLVFRPKAN